MPRLTDFAPQWINHDGRHGLGLIMTAPGDARWRLLVLFSNPIDGGSAWPGNSRDLLLALFPDEKDGREWVMGSGANRWTRTGEPPSADFATLSLSPSVDARECGHFTITNGGW